MHLVDITLGCHQRHAYKLYDSKTKNLMANRCVNVHESKWSNWDDGYLSTNEIVRLLVE